MSKEEEKAAVFRTTKVRTKLKGDSSWLQPRSEPQAQTTEEKPWIAEVKNSRLNGTDAVTSPVTSPSKSTPPPTKPVIERAQTSGYLIRGIFTKLEKSPSCSAINNFSGTTQFTKKPSESYKKIAPHTVRSTSTNKESQLTEEEQEKRTEAACSVLKKSAVRQRSYVLSAAKKYESQQEAPEISLVKTSPSFVATRVEITDDDDSATSPAPASTSAASESLPKPRKIVTNNIKAAAVTVNEPAEPKEKEEAAPAPVKEDSPPVPETDPFENMKPGCTKMATALPELIPECVQVDSTERKPVDSDASGQVEKPLVELPPVIPTPISPTPASPTPALPVPESPAQETLTPQSPVQTSPAPVTLTPQSPVQTSPAPVTPIQFQTSSVPESLAPVTLTPESPVQTSLPPVTLTPVQTSSDPESSALVTLTPESPVPALNVPVSPVPLSAVREITKTELEPEPSPKPRSSADNLTTLSDTLISFDTSSTSFKDDKTALAEEEGSFSQQTENGPEPVPLSTRHQSQDLLADLDSESNPEKTSGTLNLLANDIITMNTYTRSEEHNTDLWHSHVTTTVTESSSADPFDPYPIGTTSPNSSSDLLQPRSDISLNSPSTTSAESKGPILETNMINNALESFAGTIILIDTDNPSQGAEPGQKTLVLFERKSKENDSPWDRWTSPTIYTVPTTGREEEEQKEKGESLEDAQTETITTTTTIREIQSEPKLAMDGDETYSRTLTEKDQRTRTPSPEAKKGFVFLKEYVNISALSMFNASTNSGSDMLTSSSTSYSYGSPSTYSNGLLSSTCTYCGEQVGNDAKISIEHLNINSHPGCFKCHMCSKPMGDLLDSMFLHGGKVNCETCYAKAFDY